MQPLCRIFLKLSERNSGVSRRTIFLKAIISDWSIWAVEDLYYLCSVYGKMCFMRLSGGSVLKPGGKVERIICKILLHFITKVSFIIVSITSTKTRTKEFTLQKIELWALSLDRGINRVHEFNVIQLLVSVLDSSRNEALWFSTKFYNYQPDYDLKILIFLVIYII